ncbi:Hypothetical exported protein [Mycetohabitans rhizoxinica HKI 454]|uniref:Hypothetical exported protein n=1 Tax=Mycetohabitans rhizoxinica (strain DSM 19002 / CIP 109453 / HKI 454) TaxID=882378 RepID=E5AQL6_MYCRK|nr:Hypothetical exported protein [Mycetohabitans rhizoxinica HKI 454]
MPMKPIAYISMTCVIPFVLSACGAPQPRSNTADADAGTSRAAVRALAPPEFPLKPNPQYADFPLYTGTLGARPIEMRLGAKSDDPTGIQGEYRFLDGAAGVVLVAGELDNGTLQIEESDDGTHITGNWVGKVAVDGSIQGERMNPDDSEPQPFELQPSNAAARGARDPIHGAVIGAPSRHVGGMSNLTTDQ